MEVLQLLFASLCFFFLQRQNVCCVSMVDFLLEDFYKKNSISGKLSSDLDSGLWSEMQETQKNH